jgi:CheY-like chemotaxis protein
VFPRSVSRIVVVDDEPVIASSLAAILQMNGFLTRCSHTVQSSAADAPPGRLPDLLRDEVIGNSKVLSGADQARRGW